VPVPVHGFEKSQEPHRTLPQEKDDRHRCRIAMQERVSGRSTSRVLREATMLPRHHRSSYALRYATALS